MRIGPTRIADTFAEGFAMRYARIVITAHDAYWLAAAVRETCGYASSIISCDCEAGVEIEVAPAESPDSRPGAAILLFGFSSDALAKAVLNRVGQCAMTCATSAVYDGLPNAERRIPLGSHLRYFGDGFQRSKVIADRKYWRVPVMDGEFLVETDIGIEKGVAGGNIILQAVDLETALASARRAVESIAGLPGVITPFPAGVVRSGSKVGSRYPKLRASTNDAYCPTLRSRAETALHDDASVAYEIVINGTGEEVVGRAMAIAMRAAAGDGVPAISAGNYGGRLGAYQFRLREVSS